MVILSIHEAAESSTCESEIMGPHKVFGRMTKSAPSLRAEFGARDRAPRPGAALCPGGLKNAVRATIWSALAMSISQKKQSPNPAEGSDMDPALRFNCDHHGRGDGDGRRDDGGRAP